MVGTWLLALATRFGTLSRGTGVGTWGLACANLDQPACPWSRRAANRPVRKSHLTRAMIPNTWTDPDRWFWPRVASAGVDDCWMWTGTEHHSGYGSVKIRGKQWSAHQVAYRLTHGTPVNDVLHSCGTRLCCNPNHLYDGDDKQNAADRARHGRTARHIGELNGQARLSTAQVVMIRADTRHASVVAAEYGINIRHVYRIKSGERRQYG